MKNLSVLLMAFFVSVFASVVSANEKTFNISVGHSSKVMFSSLRVDYEGEVPVLRGKLDKRIYNSRVLASHIDYVVLNADGSVLVEGGASYTPSLSLRHAKNGASFAIPLPEPLPTDAMIQVAIHKNQASTPRLSHFVNHSQNLLLK